MPTTKTSLRQQLLLWLLLPQLVYCLAGAVLFFTVTLFYANRVIDTRLVETAESLARLSQTHHADIQRLAPMVVQQTDHRFYAISQQSGNVLHGSPDFKNTAAPYLAEINSRAEPLLFDAVLNAKQFRIAALRATTANAEPILIQVAFDLDQRNRYAKQILISTALPLALLIIITCLLVWWGIGRGLRPLAQLQSLMELRKAQDLSPLSLQDAPRELQGLSSALNHLLSGTEESINRQRRFIADAAHQLRTPLAGLKSQTELAMRESSPEGLRERLNMVHTSATRSIHLVNQLLTLARSEPGSQTGIPKVQMDLAKIIRDLTAELVPRALAARIDLGCDCFVPTAMMHGNSALLREMFINLVENAIKYIPRDGSITVRLTEDAHNYIVDVEDNGLGIPDEDKARVFERFYRREQTGNGCGLGMSIVKEIVERHAGTVELLDAQPHGLIVHVVLPKTELPA
ncbi:sensor histidine kinase [Deefgea chitinilytica]|uniref:histidine kinase n=2 Tax=Chitinibacteraceae TaxID=2897177 RepID=A0ABS2C8F8_9NEIS|nr:sensor histidine kinase [Deefgea chitinilytica]MBM9887551.1 sensor histidine kinase [Deefgea sp. CFH1-16]